MDASLRRIDCSPHAYADTGRRFMFFPKLANVRVRRGADITHRFIVGQSQDLACRGGQATEIFLKSVD
jgi:hypothetical protein